MRVFHAYLNKSTWNCSLPSQKKICTSARAKNQMAFEYQNKLFDEFKHFSTLQFWLLFEYIFDKFSLTKQSCFLKMCLKILAKHWFFNLLLDIKIFVASSGGFRLKRNKEVLTKQPMFSLEQKLVPKMLKIFTFNIVSSIYMYDATLSQPIVQ